MDLKILNSSFRIIDTQHQIGQSFFVNNERRWSRSSTSFIRASRQVGKLSSTDCRRVRLRWILHIRDSFSNSHSHQKICD